jgi:hypothetical protein
MRAFPRSLTAVAILACVVPACLGGAPARAQDSAAQDSAAAQVEEKLKGYDPATVAAAGQFAKGFNFGGMVSKSAPYLVEQVSRKLRDKNPDLTEEQIQAFVSAFLQSLFEDKGQTVERAIVLNIVEIMNKDELEALIRLQATPAGANALRKMPTLSARMAQVMPLMETSVIPRAMESAQAQMRKNGVDVKI